MTSPISEDRDEEITGAVDHTGLRVETGDGSDIAHESRDLGNVAETRDRVDGRQSGQEALHAEVPCL